MLRIVIADDHPVVLKGLKEILSETFDDVIIDGTATGYELMMMFDFECRQTSA
jgi:DNA-binding NarL/FixJ family response regulator